MWRLGAEERGAGAADPKARTPESLLFLQPNHDPHPQEKQCPSPSTYHTELEEQWKTYWVDNE